MVLYDWLYYRKIFFLVLYVFAAPNQNGQEKPC